jgi:Poly(R)-hydroxyalkanoic acid synthase subunit (PHA_synth_III_E)
MNRFIMLLSNMATRELWKTTIMDNNNDISHTDAKSTFADHERKQIKDIFNVWSDFIKLPTIGPFQAFSKDSTFYSQELFNLFQTLIQLQTNTRDYWTQMNNAYLRAVEQVADRMHNGNQNQQQYRSKDKPGRSPKENMEEYRKTIIDAFEEAFTDLFSSNDFGIINSNLISSQLDVVKHLQNIAEKNFKTLNLPTRSEVDELSKDVHDIKREIHDIKKKIGII